MQAHGGITYLRYDDTDPEKEEERFIRGIQEMVEWLGGEGQGLYQQGFCSLPFLHYLGKMLVRVGA